MPLAESLDERVARVVNATPVQDIHTHLYDPSFGSLLLWGLDDQLIYHYLVSESFRYSDLPYDRFWSASKSEQAEQVWRTLFVERSPVSEACRGVLTTLQAFGLDPRERDLPALRRWFQDQKPADFVDRVLQLANVDSVCMTNSPFDDEERAYWEKRPARDPRFRSALRIDPLLLAWSASANRLRSWGYAVSDELNAATAGEARRFLAEWTQRIGSIYCMVSLPPTFQFPAKTEAAWLIENVVLPHCRDFGQPFALMMGVKRAVNPALRMAGDGVGLSDLSALANLCSAHPQNKFLVTCLARENQHELVVLARKFRNLHPFGCWWFTNTPQLIREITTMRLELLGTSFTPQHSDARVLDQLIYKWKHTRAELTRCLAAKYAGLEAASWPVTDAEIARDVRALLGGAFAEFCGRPGEK
ncbi:MAG TPA: glucuronate isomerase [Verrucomicrobiota bacterium]|nr:glucuronate isomerase [Verrucomicrobiota bacterium]